VIVVNAGNRSIFSERVRGKKCNYCTFPGVKEQKTAGLVEKECDNSLYCKEKIAGTMIA
jgi:putative hemolysin